MLRWLATVVLVGLFVLNLWMPSWSMARLSGSTQKWMRPRRP